MGPLLRYVYLFVVVPAGILSVITAILIQWTMMQYSLGGTAGHIYYY